MKIKLLIQPKGKPVCGHCCVAMILGVSLKKAYKILGHQRETSIEDMLKALDIADAIRYNGNNKHLDCVTIQLHENPNNYSQKHWTVCNYGELLDPAQHNNLWPVKYYWIYKRD